MSSAHDEATTEAGKLADAARAINHALIHHDDFAVGDLYRVVGELSLAFSRSGTALGHMAAIVESREGDPAALRADDGSDPAAVLRGAVEALHAAKGYVAEVEQALTNAHNSMSKIADQHSAPTAP